MKTGIVQPQAEHGDLFFEDPLFPSRKSLLDQRTIDGIEKITRAVISH